MFVYVCVFAEEDHDHHLLRNLGCGLGVQYRRNSGLLDSSRADKEEQIHQTYIYHTARRYRNSSVLGSGYKSHKNKNTPKKQNKSITSGLNHIWEEKGLNKSVNILFTHTVHVNVLNRKNSTWVKNLYKYNALHLLLLFSFLVLLEAFNFFGVFIPGQRHRLSLIRAFRSCTSSQWYVRKWSLVTVMVWSGGTPCTLGPSVIRFNCIGAHFNEPKKSVRI